MNNKPLIITQLLARTIITFTLLIAITCWIAPARAQESSHGETRAQQQNDNHAEHAGEHEQDLGQQRASEIAVTEPPSWYHTVVWSIAALFILAATLGSAALILKGPEPPDPAGTHH